MPAKTGSSRLLSAVLAVPLEKADLLWNQPATGRVDPGKAVRPSTSSTLDTEPEGTDLRCRTIPQHLVHQDLSSGPGAQQIANRWMRSYSSMGTKTKKSEPSEEHVLHLEGADDPIDGNQEGRFFHGCYCNYCYLPM